MQKLDNWWSLGLALLAFSMTLAAARGVGSRLCGKSSSFHLQVIVGLNCLGLLGLCLGALDQPWPFFLLAAFALFISVVDLRRSHGVLFQACRHAVTHWTKTKALIVFGTLITLGPALTYPSGLDELTYHIELPRRWSNFGSLSVQSDLPYSSLPSLCEIVSWFTYPIESLITPRLINWAVWLHGICLLHELLKRICQPKAAGVLTFSICTSQVMLMISANCYVETFVWADAVALCFLLMTAIKSEESKQPNSIAIAVVVGGAIATKITSIGLLLLPVLALAITGRTKHPLRDTVSVVLGSLIFALPFYLRPWLLCGNPLAPYYASFFTNDPSVLATSQYHHEIAVGNFGIPGVVGALASPIAVGFANELYDGMFGLQWLALVGIAVWTIYNSSKNKAIATNPAVVMAVQGLALLAIWSVTSQQARFAIPVFLMGCIAAAAGLAELSESIQKRLRILIVALSLISLPWANIGYYLDSWLCVLKIRTPIDYIRDGVHDSYAELSLFLQERISAEDKVVTIFEHRLAYLPSSVEIATPYFQSKYFRDPQLQSTPEKIVAEFRKHQIRYVVFTSQPPTPDISNSHIEHQQQFFQGFDQCIAEGSLKVVWRSEFHAVVEVVN
jgi:hypothetical protein